MKEIRLRWDMMDYCEDIRKMIGNSPLIVVRPCVAILNKQGEVLLTRNAGGTWNIPSGILQLNESVEECMARIVLEDIGVKLLKLKLLSVYSGKELINRVLESGDEYHPVAIVYLCTEYEGEINQNNHQEKEARFFHLNQLPEQIIPFIKNNISKIKSNLDIINGN